MLEIAGELESRRFTVGELLRNGVNTLREGLSPLFTLLLLLVLPWDILGAFFPATNLYLAEGSERLIAAIVLFLTLFGALYYALAASIVVEAVAHGRRISAADALAAAWPRLFDGLTTSLYLLGVLILGLLLFILPAIYLSVTLVFSLTIVALRDGRNWSAMRYSRELVSGQFWRIFGIQLLLFLVYAVVLFPFLVVMVFIDHPLLDAIFSAVGSLPDLYYFSVFTVLFLNEDALFQDRINRKAATGK